MSDKKYQIFISSTFRDLKEERRDIAKSVLDLGHIPAAMEYFPAMDEEQLKYIQQIIDQCDYYILVIAGKYGSRDKDGVSFTEKEYDYAVSTGKFVLGFPFHDIDKLPREHTETDPETIDHLKKFREKVMAGRLVREWDNRQDLDLKVTKSLTSAFTRFPQAGWVRTPEMSVEKYVMEISRLQQANEKLSAEIKEISTVSKPTIEGLAGMDEIFTFYLEEYDYRNSSRGAQSIDITWSKIFEVFASVIKGPIDQNDLQGKFVYSMREALKGSDDLSQSSRTPSIKTRVYETMLMQMIAHGLLAEDESSNIIMTQQGKNYYLHAKTVRSRM